MSEHGKAVFLSYASQDAEAAKKICEALRAAGVEVWFDQSELVGGDAWDAKIRGQISSCALFMPVISAGTQARLEGYFRLEWKLAAQRTHTMADEKVFLLPVVVDDTRDAVAKVPPEFKAVQWTHIPGGAASEKFCARVKKLLSSEPFDRAQGRHGETNSELETENRERKTVNRERRSRAKWWWALPFFGLSMAAILYFNPPRSSEKKPPAAAAPVSEIGRLTAQAREVILRSGRGSSKWEAASLLCERALALDPTDAEALALASQVDSRLWFHVYDLTPARSERARSRAARALDLAPDGFESRLAQATYLVLVAGRPQADQAETTLRALRQQNPRDSRPIVLQGMLLASQGRIDEATAIYEEAAKLPDGAILAYTQEAWEFHRVRRIPEMEAALDRAIAAGPVAGAISLRVYYDLGWWGDLDRALANLNRMPAEELAEDNGITAAVRVYRWRRDPEALLQFLRSVPRDWIQWGVRGPKAALTGDAHATAGRTTAARTDWQAALALTDRKIAESPNDLNLLEWKAYLHARLGEADAARDAAARAREAPAAPRGLLEVEKLAFFAPPAEVLAELESRVEGTLAALQQQRRSSGFIAAADLRLNPAWDPVRELPRFQALQAKLDADPRFNPKAADGGQSTENGKQKTENNKLAAVDAKSVAVLAFANLSDDKANEYFSDGISEELLNVLAKVPDLKVSARTSAFYFKGKEVPIPEIARQLGVAYVVEGSVRRQGDKVRITAQLIKAADGFHVWSDTFTRDLKDVFAVQDEIAGLIAKNLDLKLRGATRSAAVNPEAFRLYLEGREEWSKRSNESVARAEELFKQAIALDPEFARAHAGLADVWVIRANLKRREGEDISQDHALATASLDRALQIDPALAEAHATRANLYSIQGRSSEAVQAFQRALALNPSYASAHQWYGRLLFDTGSFDAGLAELEIAIRIDPLSPIIASNYAMYLGFARRWTESLAAADRALAVRPNGDQAFAVRVMALLGLGRTDEALKELRARNGVAGGDQPELVAGAFWRAILLARAGDPETALKFAGPILAAGAEGKSLPEVFYLHLVFGRPEDAFAYAQRVNLRLGSEGYAYLDPVYDSVRDDPRFLRLIERAGALDEYRGAWAQYLAWKKRTGQSR